MDEAIEAARALEAKGLLADARLPRRERRHAPKPTRATREYLR